MNIGKRVMKSLLQECTCVENETEPDSTVEVNCRLVVKLCVETRFCQCSFSGECNGGTEDGTTVAGALLN